MDNLDDNFNGDFATRARSYSTLAGILFAVLGLFCVCYPVLASVSIDIVTGIALIVGAVFALFQMPKCAGFWRRVFYILLTILYAIAGAVLLMNPFEGTEALMVFFGFIFLSEGVLSLIYWSKLRESGSGLTILLNAVISIILSVLVLFNINMGIWFIGILVGINFLFTGFALLFSAPKEASI